MGAAAQSGSYPTVMPLPGQNGFGPAPVPMVQPPSPGQVPMPAGPPGGMPPPASSVPLPDSDQATSMRRQMAIEKLRQMLMTAGGQNGFSSGQ